MTTFHIRRGKLDIDMDRKMTMWRQKETKGRGFQDDFLKRQSCDNPCRNQPWERIGENTGAPGAKSGQGWLPACDQSQHGPRGPAHGPRFKEIPRWMHLLERVLRLQQSSKEKHSLCAPGTGLQTDWRRRPSSSPRVAKTSRKDHRWGSLWRGLRARRMKTQAATGETIRTH